MKRISNRFLRQLNQLNSLEKSLEAPVLETNSHLSIQILEFNFLSVELTCCQSVSIFFFFLGGGGRDKRNKLQNDQHGHMAILLS